MILCCHIRSVSVIRNERREVQRRALLLLLLTRVVTGSDQKHLGYCRRLRVIDYIISLSNVKPNYTNSPLLRQIEMRVIRDVVWRCPLLVNYLQH